MLIFNNCKGSRRDREAFTTSEKTKGFNNRNLTQTNTSVSGGRALPRAHMGDSSTRKPPPNPLHPTYRSTPGLWKPPWHQPALTVLGRRCALLLALHRGQETQTGPCHWNTHAYGWFTPQVLTSMEQTDHSCAPSQAEANACSTKAAGFAHFPAAKGQMSSLEGSAGPFLLIKSCIQ